MPHATAFVYRGFCFLCNVVATAARLQVSMASKTATPMCVRRWVEVEPDVRRMPLQAHDSFVVVGSDGLWDVMTDQAAIDIAQVSSKHLRTTCTTTYVQ